ncbi:extensin family protein [Roseovarius sp. S4756]|uniref:extensin-like domain-containing protein n=1 Tax=Roseovarius maritimus TaxID=3342637 RepID=UPI0037277B38
MAAVIAAASTAFAAAPDTSLRPVARPDAPEISQGMPQASAAMGASAEIKEGSGGLRSSLRPLSRPLAIGRAAQKRKEARARGMVCGDPGIQGEEVGRVPGRISGCGIDDAVKVRSIDGVALSQHALMDCRTAGAIKSWIAGGMKPAVGGYGGGVAQLRVAAHYVCRSRNNQRGTKISEHGKGRAIDIAGFQLRDGRTLTVLSDWGRGQKGQILSQMHRSACGPFGTVLGPESDRFHADHFHFDTARYRSGSYCR